MKSFIVNNIGKLTIGVAVISLVGFGCIVKELSKYDC